MPKTYKPKPGDGRISQPKTLQKAWEGLQVVSVKEKYAQSLILVELSFETILKVQKGQKTFRPTEVRTAIPLAI